MFAEIWLQIYRWNFEIHNSNLDKSVNTLYVKYRGKNGVCYAEIQAARLEVLTMIMKSRQYPKSYLPYLQPDIFVSDNFKTYIDI